MPAAPAAPRPEGPRASGMIPYPSGIRIMAFVLGAFIAAPFLFQSIRVFIEGADSGDRVRLAAGAILMAYYFAMLLIAIGLFWFKEWARSTGVWLMGAYPFVHVAFFSGSLADPTALGQLVLVIAATVSVLYYLVRPHVKAYFAYVA